jgi:hypothetical protein
MVLHYSSLGGYVCSGGNLQMRHGAQNHCASVLLQFKLKQLLRNACIVNIGSFLLYCSTGLWANGWAKEWTV